MSKPLDISLTMDDLALHVGRVTLELLAKQKQIAVLEARVDELDPPAQEEADAEIPQ